MIIITGKNFYTGETKVFGIFSDEDYASGAKRAIKEYSPNYSLQSHNIPVNNFNKDIERFDLIKKSFRDEIYFDEIKKYEFPLTITKLPNNKYYGNYMYSEHDYGVIADNIKELMERAKFKLSKSIVYDLYYKRKIPDPIKTDNIDSEYKMITIYSNDEVFVNIMRGLFEKQYMKI